MQRYDSYKPSGVKWLGEIPEHWEVKRLASYFTERRVKVSDKDFEPLSVTKLGVFPQWENVAKTNDGDNRKLVKKGDFVINSRSDRKGSSGISDRDGSVSLINIVLQPRKTILAQFSNYLLKSYRFIEEYYRNGRGIVADLWTTRYDEMKMIKLAIPPLKEQDAIANYLDTATVKIDSAIAQQQKMIDLLNERKQIIINNAVTKGLNPNAKMKDSGVEWIGEIPEGWDFVKLKHLTKIISKGTTPSTIGRDVLSSGTIRFLKAENIVNNAVCEKPDFYIDEVTHSILKRSNLQENDLLFVIAGATIGKVAILPKELTPANTNQAISFIRLQNPEISKYVWYVLQSEVTRNYIWSNAVQSAQPNISMEDLGNIQVPIPNVLEQKEIIAYIETKISPIENTIRNCQQQISFLQERKQIIINEVVTGKVKVC